MLVCVVAAVAVAAVRIEQRLHRVDAVLRLSPELGALGAAHLPHGRDLGVRVGTPDGVVPLRLKPITTTGKPPKAWDDVVRRGETALYSPSTAKETLGTYLKQLPSGPSATPDQVATWNTVNRLRSVRFLSRLLTSVLSPERDRSEAVADAEDEDEFTRGLPAYAHADGVIRTHVFPTQETGRASTAWPPLQNLCLDEDSEYLTDRGWVRVADLTATDRVAQYDPLTRQVTFVRPSAVHVSRYDGPMVHLTVPGRVDIMATPNHRLLLRSSYDHKEIEAGEFEQLARPGQSLPLAGLNIGTALTDDQCDWLALVAVHGRFSGGGGAVVAGDGADASIKTGSVIDAPAEPAPDMSSIHVQPVVPQPLETGLN